MYTSAYALTCNQKHQLNVFLLVIQSLWECVLNTVSFSQSATSKHVLPFVCVQVCVGPTCPYIVFTRQQPPCIYPLASVCVCAVCWDPTDSTDPDRPPCCMSVCLVILTFSIPPSELDIKQMKWTHFPSRWTFIWKHKALMRGPIALLPHARLRSEKKGENDKAELPWAATQMIVLERKRFMLGRNIRIYSITKEMCQSALYPKYDSCCFLNNRRPVW